jgi:hypothetical protein
MKQGIKLGLSLLAMSVLAGCVPGLFGPARFASYSCADGTTAVVDYETNPPTVTVGNTTYQLVQLQASGRWTTNRPLVEISISDRELNFYRVGGLITTSCQRV